ncbi:MULTISPECIES: hypothetical protein [unclassified Aminobacter]|uniref:hypothetical protein n=1 Tax=unclassified Aminobacter TaxID=2644704 RepID=UPI0004650305|nr:MULTISPECIES: hypothetical protein [unclassified Aminobacter]TWH35616.1 hypothetical protein L611_001200000970 [Aminobacter sp. J15]
MIETNVNAHALSVLIEALRKFNQFDPKMQVSTVLTFLEIAKADMKGEPCTNTDVEKRVGLHSGTASRNIYYWADGHKEMKGGYDLVDVTVSREDRRKRLLSLNPKGRALANQIIEGVKGIGKTKG